MNFGGGRGGRLNDAVSAPLPMNTIVVNATASPSRIQRPRNSAPELGAQAESRTSKAMLGQDLDIADVPPNGSRLSCGANGGGRKRPTCGICWLAGKPTLPLKVGPGSFKRLLGSTVRGAPPHEVECDESRDKASQKDVPRDPVTVLLSCRDIEDLALPVERIDPPGRWLRLLRHPCSVVEIDIAQVEETNHP